MRLHYKVIAVCSVLTACILMLYMNSHKVLDTDVVEPNSFSVQVVEDNTDFNVHEVGVSADEADMSTYTSFNFPPSFQIFEQRNILAILDTVHSRVVFYNADSTYIGHIALNSNYVAQNMYWDVESNVVVVGYQNTSVVSFLYVGDISDKGVVVANQLEADLAAFLNEQIGAIPSYMDVVQYQHASNVLVIETDIVGYDVIRISFVDMKPSVATVVPDAINPKPSAMPNRFLAESLINDTMIYIFDMQGNLVHSVTTTSVRDYFSTSDQIQGTIIEGVDAENNIFISVYLGADYLRPDTAKLAVVDAHGGVVVRNRPLTSNMLVMRDMYISRVGMVFFGIFDAVNRSISYIVI